MSELTQCNFCTLKDIKRRAEVQHKKVSILGDSLNGGKRIYVHPKKVKLSQDNKEEYFVAWFMELTDSCAC